MLSTSSKRVARVFSQCARFSSVSPVASSPASLHFYRNKQLELWAAKEAKLLSLRQLVREISPVRTT